MLDAHFNSKNLLLMKEWITKLFTRKGEEIKTRLSIPIARSAYPLMVPDFWGVAKQHEKQMYNQSWVREWAADVAACIPDKGFVSDRAVETTVRSAALRR